MIIVIFLVSIALICLGAWIFENLSEGFGGALLGIGIPCGIISLITLIVLAVNVSSLAVIDTKIAMYQEENAIIESQIAECVEQYQKYETEIFTEVAPESAVTLVALYPELKSDTLVSKQIDIYLENNQTIKGLKSDKINGDIWRWWLYFGSSVKKGGE